MSDIKDFIIKDGILERYTGNDEHIIIPKTVKTISSYAFRFVRKGTLSITISEGTEEINASAFKNFINLERINLPTSLKVIGDEAFRNCEKLKEIVFDGILKEIGNLAFWGCWSLFETADNLPEFLQKFVYRVNSGELTTEEANVLYEISKSKGVININSFRTVYFTDGVFPGYIYCFNDGETRLFIPVSIDGIPVVKAPCRNVPDDAVVYCPAEYFDKLSRQAKVTTTLKWLGGDKLIKESLSDKIKTFIKKYPDDIILKFENIEDSKIIRRFFEYVKPEAQYIDKLLALNPNSPEIKAVLLDLNKPLTNDTDVFSLDSVNKMTVSELKKIWTYDTITNSDTNQKEICLTNYKSHDKHVVVPAYIGKMPVVKIKGVFPEYVESIAFENPDIEINCSFRLCKSMADKNGFVCINIGNRYVLTD